MCAGGICGAGRVRNERAIDLTCEIKHNSDKGGWCFVMYGLLESNIQVTTSTLCNNDRIVARVAVFVRAVRAIWVVRLGVHLGFCARVGAVFFGG